MEFIFGGDQLTVCQNYGAQSAWSNDDKPVGRLEGLIPVAEDWHTRLRVCVLHVVNLVDVIKYLTGWVDTLLYLINYVFVYVCYNVFTLWNLFQVIWKCLFNKNSAAEKGTLYQLKNCTAVQCR